MNTLKRCAWTEGQNKQYVLYHDVEWGVPVHDDCTHFEFLILEGAQAGLSWSTILNRREGYRRVFREFHPEQVAGIKNDEIDKILLDAGIIRNRLKVEAAVINAKKFLQIQTEFGSFDKYIWRFVDDRPVKNNWKHAEEVPAKTEISDLMSKDLKKRGFKFVGSTIMYAYMQACGLVNDHTTDCFRYKDLSDAKND
jgi:DNA-3-methyladenine glycosylase I